MGMRRSIGWRQGERGVALLSALVLMLAVLLTGIASTRFALQDARAAEHERDRVLALQMAQAALADAERDIEGGAAPASGRAAAFVEGRADAFAGDCRGGTPYQGLCAHQADAGELAATLLEDDGPAVPFGAFTGRHVPDGEAGLPREAPRYLIELLPPVEGELLYRITARGAGSLPGTAAALQAYYRKPPDGAPGRRIGWRELGNWGELAAAAAASGAGGASSTSRGGHR